MLTLTDKAIDKFKAFLAGNTTSRIRIFTTGGG
jgi:Fe-S cluster assembly iron-binding protein IscA